MTSKSLSRVTLQTLENYRTAASQGVVAYRLGGHRLVRVVNGTLKNTVYPRTAKIAPRATDRLDEVRGSVSGYVVKGIDQIARNTEKVIDLGSDTAAQQVTKLARFADGIDNEVVSNGLHTAARLTMPGAQVALALSSKVAERATALAEAAAGRPVQKAVRKAAAGAKRRAAPVTRKVKTTTTSMTQAANRRAKQVAKAAKAPVATARKTARTAKKVVADAVAA
jgi:hypothetical protein